MKSSVLQSSVQVNDQTIDDVQGSNLRPPDYESYAEILSVFFEQYNEIALEISSLEVEQDLRRLCKWGSKFFEPKRGVYAAH